MTSQLLRKLQTILWSTPPKIDAADLRSPEFRPTSVRRSGLLRDAGIAGMAVLALSVSAFGEDTKGRSRINTSTIQRPEIASPMGSEEGVRPASANSKMPIRRATHTRVLPEVSDTPGTQYSVSTTESTATRVEAAAGARNATQSNTAPGFASQARQQIAPGPDRSYGRVPQTDEGFASRMDYVLSGGVVTNSAESVGDWWRERSGRMVNRGASDQTNAQPSMQRLAGATTRMMDRVTLPDETLPEVDFYDANPTAISASQVQQTSGQESSENTSELSATSRLKTDIRAIQPTLNYAMKNIVPDQLPEDFDTRLDSGEYQPRVASPLVYQWAPTNLYHYPLYFEDPSLERYGHTYHPFVQPFASSGRFATQLVGLPYQMALHPVHSQQYALGYYRPGEWAPKKHYQIPFNEEATLVEAAAIVGLFFIIP